MTTSRDTPASRRVRANGDGTVYQRKDGRWEAAGYVLAPGNTQKRVRVYGTTRKEALAKLTEKISASNRGLPVPSAQGSLAAYLNVLAGERRHPPPAREHPHPLHHLRQPLPRPRPRQEKAHQAHRQGRPHLAQPAPHHLPVLRAGYRRPARPARLLRRRPVLPQAALPTDAHLHPLRAQVRPGACRPRGRDPAQRCPQRPHRHRTAPPLRTPHCRRSPTVPHRRARSPATRAVRTRPPHRTPQRRTPRPALEDFDLDTGTAAIRRTLQRTNAGGLTTLPTKTRASERRIALPTRCVQSLKLHHEQQKREREAVGTTWQRDGHVFTTVQGRPIDPTNLTRAFITLLRTAGLRRIRFHDLRHSTATLLLEQGVELVVIKELLGHAHIGVTATVYAYVRLRLQREALTTLGNALDRP